MIVTRNKTSEKVISNSKISVPSKIKKDKSVVVKKRKVNVAFEETDADNSFDSLYSKIYDKVMADVAKEMNDREKLLASNFEAQIQKAAMNNRHLLDQRWTLLPELVNQATSRVINAKNEKDKIFKNCLDQELENRPNQSSLYSKDDFFSCFNEITSTVVFREVFLKHKSKLDNIRDRFKGFKKSDILLLNIDSSKEDEEFSRNLNCYQSSFKICRDRRLSTEEITDESEESVAETKSEPSSNDNRKIVSLVGETESEKVIRVLESDKIRATLLSLINCITSHKLMSKFFYEGNGTIFGISLIDLPAPDAFDFMITQIADYIFLYVGIPEIITVQIQDPTTVETRILNLSSKLDYYDLVKEKVCERLRYERKKRNKASKRLGSTTNTNEISTLKPKPMKLKPIDNNLVQSPITGSNSIVNSRAESPFAGLISSLTDINDKNIINVQKKITVKSIHDIIF